MRTIDVAGEVCDDQALVALTRAVDGAGRSPDTILRLRLRGDLTDPVADPSPETRRARAGDVVAPLIRALARTPALVAACADGRLVGTPAVLAILAHVVVLAPAAELVPYASAAPPAPGTGWLLRRVLPPSTVVDLAITGRGLTADVAQQLGVITAVAADPARAVDERLDAVGAAGPPGPSVRLAAALAGPDRAGDLDAVIAHDVELAALWGMPCGQ